MGEEHIRISDRNSISTLQPSPSPSPSPFGGVVNALLSSHSRKLEAAISRLGSTSQTNPGVLLDDSLCYLKNYMSDAVDKREPLDQILVPMIEHTLKRKGLKNCKQVLILLNWLFEDDLLFEAISINLVEIIKRKQDHYISFGWCNLVRALLDTEINPLKVTDIGKQEKRNTLLKTLCCSISDLLSIICKGSIPQDGFELPTRLSVAAADCILLLTEALTNKAPNYDVSSSRTKSSSTCTANRPVSFVQPSSSKKERSLISKVTQDLEDLKMELLLWQHIEELVTLVQKLQAWNRKSRPLHAYGLQKVLKWLQDIRQHYSSSKDEAGGKMLKTGALLLSSCWRHYVTLLFLEDHRFSQRYMEMLDQYISAIQLYAQDNSSEQAGCVNTGIETRKFFLNCIALLWGRLENSQVEIAISACGEQISNLLLLQLQCIDEDVTEGSLGILRAIIFKMDFSSNGSGCADFHQMEVALTSLLNFLDERDCAARALVLFCAEYCSLNPDGQFVEEILKRLDSGNQCQRRNAIDVIAEFVRISSDSGRTFPLSLRKDIAEHLLDRLIDEEVVVRMQASYLITQIDPALVLPALLQLLYSKDERVSSSASDAVVAILKSHNKNFDVISMLLDSLSNLCQNPGCLETSRKMKSLSDVNMESPSDAKLDPDLVLRMIPRWSESVQDWSTMIESLIDKMFSDPSNAILVRFMSHISEHLAASGDLVLHRILFHTRQQKEMDESLKLGGRSFNVEDSVGPTDMLFDHLCSLLIIRVLPLKIFNDLHSSVMYGQLLKQGILQASHYVDLSIKSDDCVAALLINRAFLLFEFEEVRKLAAELCGRLHPQVLLPIVQSIMGNATHNLDTPKLKACLFALCTSLVVRGQESASHPDMVNIRKMLETVLLWPSADTHEVSKAQHGCIDCLALMVCAELQAPVPAEGSASEYVGSSKEQMNYHGPGTVSSSVLSYVMQRLLCCEDSSTSAESGANAYFMERSMGSQFSNRVLMTNKGLVEHSIPIPFRVCMANVLISVCQKISSSGKQSFARRVLSTLILSIEVVRESLVRAACLQVLFSAVYHLKSAVLPHSSALLKISIKALRKGSEKERVAGAKLMASLMASDDTIVYSISSGLLEAKSVLESISSKNSPPELQQLCERLLKCVTLP